MDTKADKLHKKAIRDQQKRIKPGECQKYVRLVLDSEILYSNIPGLGLQLQLEIEQLQLKYVVRDLPAKMCIIWERQSGQRELLSTDDIEQQLTSQWDVENQVLQFHTAQELGKSKPVKEIVQNLRTHFPDAKPTIAVLARDDKSSDSNSQTAALIDLQVLHQVATLQVPPMAKEVAATLRRFTKAIAEAPYKQQKSESLGTFKKFLANDKKQCVRVVGTSGFGRLWQQHLNRLPLVTLEVAETIIAQYPCPKRLLDAYERDAAEEKNTMADLKINRAGPQPLQADRRIGNVLSGKLYLLYNSRDPNAVI
ncbi:PREDICTED: crossover junction endonuclease EME1 [Rhagoletis zephyria]|uniref:crossover junction endonuclease EME1 n=1 Tax=Rhagoletis zephyria TaxID=28612 RepID=UPI0008118738|nr:PREDICTED: crossover junction endonuclease EME1 [Rhagoletis zephyria]